ncbi:hypothetical protein F4604DRAFT_1928964 [Suillus subluteus]|nr:hypothetical protein F4604DRAFT_1928964 [Suillus subluteus]
MDGTTEGLVHGQRVVNTGAPIQIPMGAATLGHIMDVIGEPIDEHGDSLDSGTPQQRCQSLWWFLCVDECTRKGNDLYHEMIETGVINLEGDSKLALVFSQMNGLPGSHAHVALTGFTIAKYFCDEEGYDVLLFIDNIFRFT